MSYKKCNRTRYHEMQLTIWRVYEFFYDFSFAWWFGDVSGLMTLLQATGVIMGANIGTTITAQLIAFKLSDIAPLVLFAGMIMTIFVKKEYFRNMEQLYWVLVSFLLVWI